MIAFRPRDIWQFGSGTGSDRDGNASLYSEISEMVCIYIYISTDLCIETSLVSVVQKRIVPSTASALRYGMPVFVYVAQR